MSDGTNLIALILGVATTALGIILTIKTIVIIKMNEIVNGKIVDRTSDRNEHYVPVIEYKDKENVKYYTSNHYSVFQKVGGKIRIIHNKKKNEIIGTLGGMLFKPIMLMLAGIFIATVVLLYELTK